jgi:lysophospholipase L1-like esterase
MRRSPIQEQPTLRTRLLAVILAAAVLASVAAVPGVAAATPAGTKPKVKVLMLGDSVGQGLALKGLQKDKRLEVVQAATVNCTLSGGTLQGYRGNVIGSGCPDWRTAWPPLVQQNAPDVVIVFTGGWEIVDRWFSDPGQGFPNTILDPVFQQDVSDATKEAASLLSIGGAKVTFPTMPYIDPPHAYPEPPGVNGISEIWWEPYGPDAPPAGYQAPLPGQPFVSSKAKVDALNKIRLDLAGQDAINVFDLNKFVSPKGVYTDKLKGKLARDTDRSHFNDYGYKKITVWLAPKLQKLAGQN